jgi:N-acetylmuramoyl-L-alanine amidase
MRRAIPWFGLLLLTTSFVWFIRLLGPTHPVSTMPAPSVRHEPPAVVLDPGHGGADSGAMCGTIMEKNLTLDVALRAESLLHAQGYSIALTRESDRYVSLAERIAVGNRAGNSLFISIHFNDGERATASGVETYYASRQLAGPAGFFSWLRFLERSAPAPLALESKNLARFIQTALVERTQAVDRGIKSGQFYVIANLRHPAALIEGGFITNKSDMMKLTTTEYREEIARAISDGVHRHCEAIRRGEPTLAVASARPE